MGKVPQVVFANETFVVLDKPAGWLSVPSRMGRQDPRSVAGIWLQEHLAQQVWPVHRLDAEVSGLLMFALTADSHRRANAAFENHLVRKLYRAYSSVLAGLPEVGATMEWRCRLAKGKKRAFEAPHGKESLTVARFIGVESLADRAAARWELQPRTGRSHQLRYEMSRHGFPIDGDRLYGSEVGSVLADGIALRAVQLIFTLWDEAPDFRLPATIQVSDQ